MDIISIGEAVIDFIPGKEEASYIRNAGGAPANVAIAASRNGLDVGIYTKVGDDDFGRFIIDTLKENKVKILAPELCKEAITTMAFVTLSKDNDRSFTFARKPGADMMLSKEEIKDDDISSCKLLQAGSCSLSAGKAAEATEYAMKKAHEMGKLVGFDINYRNLMWNDDKDKCTQKVLSILKYVDLLKLSEEEEDMLGGRDNIHNVMKEHDIAVAVLTLGGDGARVYFNGETADIPTFKADHVADTTGAGDAFWGGFISKLLIDGCNTTGDFDMDKLKTAVRYGNAAGSLSVREKGAITSLPTREKTENFLKEN